MVAVENLGADEDAGVVQGLRVRLKGTHTLSDRFLAQVLSGSLLVVEQQVVAMALVSSPSDRSCHRHDELTTPESTHEL